MIISPGVVNFHYKFNKDTRTCECGKKYIPASPNQKWCSVCRVIKAKESNQRAKRRREVRGIS